MNSTDADYRKFCVHGLGMRLACAVEMMERPLAHFLRMFAVGELPDGVVATQGTIRPFNEAEVLRHLPTSARRTPQPDPWLEFYQDEERFWLVDERWGMAEVNFLRSQWRSWILPQPSLDPVRLFESAVLWPMAQLFRARGLHLLPAASITRDGWGVLLLATFPIDAELARLIEAGYCVVGQRWTALRSEQDRVEMLHVPGVVQRHNPPRRRAGADPFVPQWIDLAAANPQAARNHAYCDLVLIAEPARRAEARAHDLSVPEAQDNLRRSWPILDLHPTHRSGLLPTRIGQLCRCAQLQLARDPGALVVLLDSIHATIPSQMRLTLFTRQARGQRIAQASSRAS